MNQISLSSFSIEFSQYQARSLFKPTPELYIMKVINIFRKPCEIFEESYI